MTGIYLILVVFVKVLTMLIASSVPHLLQVPKKRTFLITFSQFLPSISRKWVPPVYWIRFGVQGLGGLGVPWKGAVFPSSIRAVF